MEYWESIKDLGHFYLEMELVVGTETVLFVCKNKDKRYLFMAYNSNELDYVFCLISNKTLLDMLTNKITMEQAFRASDVIRETYETSDNKIGYKEYKSDKFEASKLPSVGAFYNIDSYYIKNYIKELEQE